MLRSVDNVRGNIVLIWLKEESNVIVSWTIVYKVKHHVNALK